MLKIRYNAHNAQILSGTSDVINHTIDEALAFTIVGADESVLTKPFVWQNGKRVYNKRYLKDFDPRTHLFKPKTGQFPTGLLTKVMGLFPDSQLEAEHPIPTFQADQQLDFLYGYQKEVVEALVGYARGIAEVPTGGGKTVITSELVLRAPGMLILITVPSVDLLHQTRDEVAKFTGLEVGIYGDSEHEIKQVTVATIQSICNGLSFHRRSKELQFDMTDLSISKRLAWLHQVSYWITDETHGAASESYQLASAAMPATMRRHGLTATYRREDGAMLALEGVIGPLRIRIPPKQLVDGGFLVTPRIELHILEHKSYREGRQKPVYAKLERLAVVDNPNRHDYIRSQVLRNFEDGYWPQLVMFNKLEHGDNLYEVLKDLGRVELVSGKTPGKKRRQIQLAVEAGEIDVVVVSTVWVTGVNIKRLKGLIVAGAGRSGIAAVQRAGRVLRSCEGKTDARIIDICDSEEAYLKDQYHDRRFYYREKYPGCVTEIEVPGLV